MRRALILSLPLAFVLFVGQTCKPDGGSTATGVTPILLVQGDGHRSPLEGAVVTIEGTVTAVRHERVTGFWVEESLDRDRDSSLAGDGSVPGSSGLFIKTRGEPEFRIGDSLRITGNVVEYERPGVLSVTQIDPAEIETAASAAHRPEPIRIGPSGRRIPEKIDDDGLRSYEPDDDAIDFWESLEGMLVEIGRATVVGPTNRFGDFVIVPAGEADDTTRTSRGGVLLLPGNENTERIIVDQSLLGEREALAVGDVIEGPVVGVVNYDFGNYRLMATDLGTIEKKSFERPEPPGKDDATLSIASYNVLNLSAADRPERFDRLADSVIHDLGSPEVIAMQEIQDDTGGEDDGVVSAEATLRRLAGAIESHGGPRYVWRQIDPVDNADGGAPGANIRVAYLLNTERLKIAEGKRGGSAEEVEIEGRGNGTRLSLNPGRIGTKSGCFLGEGSSDESEGTRKSLALQFSFRGETYFLINNHLKSKRGDDGSFGAIQPPVRHTEDKRRCQAEVVAGVAREILERDPEANVIVLGDMNEHEFRRPMNAFEESGLISMIKRVPQEERYTYNYLGNSQVLDHAFVSPSVATRARLFAMHVNSNLPDSLAVSDHDPLLLMIAGQ